MDDQYLKRRLRETRQRLPSPDAVIQQCQNNVVMLLSRINMHEYSFFNETLILREHKSSMSLVNGEKTVRIVVPSIVWLRFCSEVRSAENDI